MTSRPTTIAGTRRQRITSKSGIALERSYIFMPSECWDQLQALCFAQGRSGSEVVQSLIKIASIGTPKEKNDSHTSN
jgi:hypothetical protein